MVDATGVNEMVKRIEDVDSELDFLYTEIDALSDAQSDGRFLRTVQHLAEACDAITAARNAFRDAAAL